MDSPLPSPEPAPIGRIIAGKYRIDALLGHGGRGGVYRAHQIELARDVALKLITGVDDESRARFLQEARLAAEVRHPCVAEVFDAGVSEDGTPYCAMELLQGETLAARIAREGPIEPQQAVTVVAGVCSALAAVHAKRLVHRDVKPSNIFLARRPDGGTDPKLIDFGIAKRVDVGPQVTQRVSTARGLGAHRPPAPTAPGIVVGTPLYLSPEQIMGEPPDARTDVHALGATLYEALCGQPPFLGGDTQDILTKILTEPPAPLAQRAPDAGIPDALDREVRRALAKDPAERHAGAGDFAAALWTALASARRDSPLAPLPVHVAASRSPRLGIVGAVIAMSLALLVIAWVRRAPHPAPPALAPVAAAPVVAPTATEQPAVIPAATAETAPAATRARPEPRVRAPRASAVTPTSTAAPQSTPTAAPSATAFRIDDLKVPY